MRTYVLIFIGLCGMVACRTKEGVAPGKIYTGKVLNSICGNTTVQFTDGTTLGQVGWLDPTDSTSYDYVFRVANPCTAARPGSSAGTSGTCKFRFTKPTPQNCIQCMAWGPTPDTAYYIQVLE